MFRDENTDKNSEFMKVFEEASKTNDILFAYSDISEGFQASFAELMDVKSEDMPTLRAFVPTQMQKYTCVTKPSDLTI